MTLYTHAEHGHEFTLYDGNIYLIEVIASE